MKKEIKCIEISISYDPEELPEHYGCYDTVNDAMEALLKLDLDYNPQRKIIWRAIYK